MSVFLNDLGYSRLAVTVLAAIDKLGLASSARPAAMGGDGREGAGGGAGRGSYIQGAPVPPPRGKPPG